jgi:hypothetical protein
MVGTALPKETLVLEAVTVRDFLFTVIVPVTVAVSQRVESVGVNSNRTLAVPAPVTLAELSEIEITEVLRLVYANEPATLEVTVSRLKEESP